MTRLPAADAALLVFALGACAVKKPAEVPAPAEVPQAAAPTPATPKPDSAAAKSGPGKKGIRPYREVITERATSDSGLFVVHAVGDTIHRPSVPGTFVDVAPVVED